MIAAPDGLKIRYLNVQHWTDDKNTALTLHLTKNEPDVLLFTSTSRLRDQTHIKIPFYTTHHTNKANELHAGTGIAIKKGIRFEIINFHHDTIGAKIFTTQGPIVVMTSYSPPRHRYLPNQDLEYLIRHQLPTILVGDLNCRHRTFGYNSGFNPKGRALHKHIMEDRINHIGPTFNTFHTRTSSTKPDIVLTNNRFYHNYHISSGGIGPSDHITINITISTGTIMVPQEPYPDEANTDWDNYKTKLLQAPEISYEELEGKNLVDLSREFDKLYREIREAKEQATPMKTIQKKNNLRTTAKFKRLTKILSRYHERLMTHGKTIHLERVIRETQLALIQEGNVCKQEWWEHQLQKVELAAKCNKKFWRKVTCLAGKKKKGIPTLKYMQDNTQKTAKTDKEKEQVFTNLIKDTCKITDEENAQYCQENEERVNAALRANADRITPKFIINMNRIRNPNTGRLPISNLDVVNAIKSLANKAPGKSRFRRHHLMNLTPNIISNICHLFNACYATGTYPRHFKTAEIIMIPKEGTPTADPSKYRPISLLNLLGKAFARILHKKLVTHLEETGIIKESQHGFRKRRGTHTLIANLYERISREKGTDRRTLVTMVLRDASKAFDKCWHRSITYKLMQTGIDDNLLCILTDFLHARQAYIRINKHEGPTFNLEAGVPQGDVLSPTLFLLISNDFPAPAQDERRRNFCMQYADDFTQVIITKCNTRITEERKLEHKRNIEEEITKQNEFERKWKIKTNMQKFVIINIGFYKAPQVNINNQDMEYATEARLLGLHFKRNNFFVKQVFLNTNKARAELKKLHRFRYLKKKLKVRLYKALVLPLLTYPVIPINICSRTQIIKLQRVQNNAIRWICNERWPIRCPTEQRHQELKIEKMDLRVRRLAEGVWHKIEEENDLFYRETLQIQTPNPHNWFPSSYDATFQ